MTRQCAWCGRVLGQMAPLDDFSVTHGLCRECHAKIVVPEPHASDADPACRDPHEGPKSGMLSVDVAE